MSLGGILLGLVNIGIVIAVLILIGLLVQWILSMIAGITIPPQIVKIYLVIVALIAVYMVIALLLGMPTLRIVGPLSVAA